MPTVIGTPVQGNFHTWNNGSVLTFNNDIGTAPVAVLGGTVEFYAAPVLLSLMNPGSIRTPLASAALPIQPALVSPGCLMKVPVPQPPPGATYAMFTFNLGDQQGQGATMDFIQMPLDGAIQPVVTDINPSQGVIRLTWPTLPDRSYRVQAASNLTDSFFDVFVDLMADGTDMSKDVPISGPHMFYKIVLDPE